MLITTSLRGNKELRKSLKMVAVYNSRAAGDTEVWVASSAGPIAVQVYETEPQFPLGEMEPIILLLPKRCCEHEMESDI